MSEAVSTELRDQRGLQRQDRAVVVWLVLLLVMVFAMILLGGVTRLNNAGLSMVEWQPVTGWLPPFDARDWQIAFEKYQQYPEYQHLNVGMTLTEFKFIFWLEFGHRLWGRLIGVVLLLPIPYFLWRGWIGRVLMSRLVLLFLLGAAQGVMGWYMVMSGLADEPDVSPYRLTAHLALGLLIYGLLLRIILRRARAVPNALSTGLSDSWRQRSRMATGGLLMMVFLTALAGGFVAGLDAGFTYNTFPQMDGHLIPEGLWEFEPWWRNLFENITTVQFDHRVLAMTTAATAVAVWLATRGSHMASVVRLAGSCVLLAALAQVGLGIATLLLVVPVALAVLHQAGALILFASVLWLFHELRPGPETVVSEPAAVAAGVGAASA